MENSLILPVLTTGFLLISVFFSSVNSSMFVIVLCASCRRCAHENRVVWDGGMVEWGCRGVMMHGRKGNRCRGVRWFFSLPREMPSVLAYQTFCMNSKVLMFLAFCFNDDQN